MKPFKHANGSVRRWGGKREDYQAIHDFIDSSKMAMPDMRHRALYHHAVGCYLVERVFGHTLVNSDGREVSTRDVAENHIIEDLGFLPSLEDWFDEMPLSSWHGGIQRLPKDERPPTPGAAREARSARVRTALVPRLATLIRSAILADRACDPVDVSRLPDDQLVAVSDEAVAALVAAVLGTSEHQEEADE